MTMKQHYIGLFLEHFRYSWFLTTKGKKILSNLCYYRHEGFGEDLEAIFEHFEDVFSEDKDIMFPTLRPPHLYPEDNTEVV